MSQIRSFLAIDLDDDFKPKVNKIIKEFKKIDANKYQRENATETKNPFIFPTHIRYQSCQRKKEGIP